MSVAEHEIGTLGEVIANGDIPGVDAGGCIHEIQQMYLHDERPWVVGYSGGKDSTITAELVYHAIQLLPSHERHKPVFVVSSDTLVETPVVVNLIRDTLDAINGAAERDELPITAHQVTPRVEKTFWVNLLGKGYPAPTPQFRWCTENMKIDPVTAFIKDKISRYGEVVVVLGARTDESSTRAQAMQRHAIENSRLKRHSSLPNAFVYTPIEDWSADDVWMALLQAPTPWGRSNQALFELYKDSNQGECPLVIDSTTPSCGNSRFGCWTCTVVTKDRAMESLIESGETWMQRLSEFRNKLAESNNPGQREFLRNFKRRTGRVTFYSADRIDDDSEHTSQVVRGPYLLSVRKAWLKELLTIEKGLSETEHAMELITRPELHQIRQEWLNDPNEPDWDDSLPKIFREVYGEDLGWVQNDAGAFGSEDAELIHELAASHETSPQLVMRLLDLELSLDGLSKRSGIFQKMGNILHQDWDSLEEIQTSRTVNGTQEYRQVAKGLALQGRTTDDGKARRYRDVYEEVSDKLLAEAEHYDALLKELESTGS